MVFSCRFVTPNSFVFGDEEATSVECYTESFNYTYKVGGSLRWGRVRRPPALISPHLLRRLFRPSAGVKFWSQPVQRHGGRDHAAEDSGATQAQAAAAGGLAGKQVLPPAHAGASALLLEAATSWVWWL